MAFSLWYDGCGGCFGRFFFDGFGDRAASAIRLCGNVLHPPGDQGSRVNGARGIRIRRADRVGLVLRRRLFGNVIGFLRGRPGFVAIGRIRVRAGRPLR
ncbi:hypothetical protein [Actinoallomurus sp. NPDC050550]|uniref:hypothetical protein n=1 Tax=Actinoallomurus sp. NPDC050550 TaxID=3154937 RepID=UPI0033CB6A6B